MTTTMKTDIERYHANLRAEQEGATLYQLLAKKERDEHLAELYRRMAEVEQRHASVWVDYLRRVGETVPPYTPGWRIRTLALLAQRFGVSAVLPLISTMERKAVSAYDTQPEAQAAGMPAEERSHVRIFRAIQTSTHGGIAGPVLARFEGRHRATSGGNALRAAVLGASDGLTTNLSLVMGVAGANLPGHTILFTGLAGMLAGALSMAIGEWLSVQSARELYTRQIEVERQELAAIPEEEQEELALIYQAGYTLTRRTRHRSPRVGGVCLASLDHLVSALRHGSHHPCITICLRRRMARCRHQFAPGHPGLVCCWRRDHADNRGTTAQSGGTAGLARSAGFCSHLCSRLARRRPSGLAVEPLGWVTKVAQLLLEVSLHYLIVTHWHRSCRQPG